MFCTFITRVILLALALATVACGGAQPRHSDLPEGLRDPARLPTPPVVQPHGEAPHESAEEVAKEIGLPISHCSGDGLDRRCAVANPENFVCFEIKWVPYGMHCIEKKKEKEKRLAAR